MAGSRFERRTKNDAIVELSADIVAAYVAKNPVPLGQLPSLIEDVHKALSNVTGGAIKPVEAQKPAVPIKKSITPDYLISLESGKKFKSLKRHLMTAYGMTPDDYRRKWSLPSDYPMVASNYAASRSALAKGMGPKRAGQPVFVVKTRAAKATK